MCCIEILVVSNFDPLSNCCKRIRNSGSLSTENKGKRCTIVYGNILSSPLTILSSVLVYIISLPLLVLSGPVNNAKTTY